MKIFISGHKFNYETEKLCRIFLPFEKFEFVEDNKEECDIGVILSKGNEYNMVAFLNLLGKECVKEKNTQPLSDKECERELAVLLYNCFCELTGYKSSWGILTGVRPAKLYSALQKQNGVEFADKYFLEKLLVSPKKLELAKACNKGEAAITSLSKEKSFSLYIGIPFCPSRCSYCSFVSHSVEQAKKLIPEYVEYLCREIEYTGKIAKDLELRLETIYIGGATPTSLTAEQLTKIMDSVKKNFNLNYLREYTVEAGRPDTVTYEKLLAIKNGGADRVSINPQTMNDNVLETIGRKHTVKQTEEALALAKEIGFKNINMDLIAGLPSDSLESFKNTVDRVVDMDPESITIHTLCLKRSATLNGGDLSWLKDGDTASNMVDYAKEKLEKAEYYPYYMYRQSKMVGNLENVGYSKVGYEGLYNVYIMDETHSILACGATAVTKLRKYNDSVIERIYNFKYPYEYISRFEEQMARKERIYSFYGEQNK